SPYALVARPVAVMRFTTSEYECPLPVASSIQKVVCTEHDHGSDWSDAGVLASKRASIFSAAAAVSSFARGAHATRPSASAATIYLYFARIRMTSRPNATYVPPIRARFVPAFARLAGDPRIRAPARDARPETPDTSTENTARSIPSAVDLRGTGGLVMRA